MAKFDAMAYSRNVLRSAGYIATETIKGVNPTLTGYISETKSDMKEMYDNVKEFKRNPKGKISDILEGAGFKEVERAKSNILDDIRTGKFYNPEREKSSLDNYMKSDMGFDFNLDDLDLNVDEDFGEDNSSSSGNSSAAINNLSLTQQRLTAASTDEIVKGYSRGTQANITNNTRMFGMVNTSLSVINSSIVRLHQDLATPLNNHIINSSNFYQTATSELSKQTAYLQHIDSLLTGRYAPTKSGFGNSSSKMNTWNDVMNGGLPNLKKLFGSAKKKAWDNSSIGFISDMFTPDMIEMFSSSGMLDSPIAMLLSMAATTKLQNSATGKSIDRLVNTLQSGSISAFSRIHQYNKKSTVRKWNQKTGQYELKNKGMLGWLANLFDIFPDVKGGAKIDRSKYRPFDRADWTNKDSRALELIPDMLSNIYAALSGTTPQVYDYKAGIWKNRRDIKNEFDTERLTNIKNSTSSFNYELLNQFVDNANKNADSSMPTMSTSSRAARMFAHDYELILKELTLSKIDISSIDRSVLTRFCNTLARRGVINKANVNIIVRTIYDSPVNNAASLQNAVLQARIADNSFMENSASSTYARSTNSDEFYKGRSLADGLLKVVDDKGHDMFFYLQNYYMRLEEIRDILSYGRGESAVNRLSNNGAAGKIVSGGSGKRYTVPKGKSARQFIPRGATRGTIGAIDINDISSRDLYESSSNQYIAAQSLPKASNKTEEKKKDESNPISRSIDKVTNWLSDVLTGQGKFSEEFKEKGLIGYMQTLPDKITEGFQSVFDKFASKAKEFLDSIRKWAEESAGGKSFGQATKDILTGFGKSLYNHAKSRANSFTGWINENAPWVAQTAEPSGSYRGGQVTKSGMVSVSEGEMIIPSEYNPFYHGHTSKSHQKATESMNYRNWLASGSRGGKYWGSFANGGLYTGGLTKGQKTNITKLRNKGFSVDEIAKKLKMDPSLVEDYIGFKDTGRRVVEAGRTVNNTARDTFNKVKNSDIGKKAEDLGSKLATGIDKSMTNLFGKGWGEVKDDSKIAIDTIKKTLPDTAAAGALGALVGGAVTGSGLGLLGGFVIGSGIMTLKNSTELNEKLFGKEDSNGNFSGGKLPPNVSKFIKKKLPGAAKSGALGTVLGAMGIAPGGMLGGFVLGAGIDLLAQNEKVRNTVTQLLFGNKDVNGKRNGGIIGSLKVRVVDPLADYVKDGMDKVTDYFKTEILSPLKKAVTSIGDWVKGKGTKILSGVGKIIIEGAKGAYHNLDAMFDGSIGRLLTATGKLGDKAIKMGADVLKTPFRLIGKGADALNVHNIKQGYSSANAKERMTAGGNANSQYTKYLAGLMDNDGNYSAEGENFIRQVNWYSNGANKNKAALKDAEMNMADTVIASLNNGGMGDPKTRNQLSKLFKAANKRGDADYSAISEYVKNLDNSKMSADNRAAVLKYIEDTTADIKQKKQDLTNYDQEQIKFFKDNKDKLGNMLTIGKDGKITINQKALNQTAMQSRLDASRLGTLSEETLKKSIAENASKATEEARLKEAATVDPLGKQRNTILEDIQGMIKKMLNIQEEDNGEAPAANSGIPGSSRTKEYSDRTKAKIKDLYKQGLTAAEIAEKLHLKQEKVDRELGNQIVSEEAELAKAGRKDWKINQIKNSIPGKVVGGVANLGRSAINALTESGGASGLDNIKNYANKAFTSVKNSAMNLVNPFREEHEEGETKSETVDGYVLTYVWKGGKWNPDMTDSETNKYFSERNKSETLKNKFFSLFTTGSLLEGIKGIFGGNKDDKKDDKKSLWDKLKEGASTLFDKFFGSNSVIGSALSGLLSGGLGTLLKSAFEGLVNSGTLATILAGAGIVLGSNALATNDAGTDKDSGMRNDMDADERKREVENMSTVGKTVVGLRNLENHITNKNMLAYSSDDFVSSYTVDRGLKAAATNLATGAAFNGALGKAAAGVASNTIGRIPIVGKALAAPLTATGKLGSALANGTNIFKVAATKLAGSESFTDTMAKGGKIGEKIYDTVDAIGQNGVLKTAGEAVGNSKVGQAIGTAAKKFSETGVGKAASNIVSKVKEKVKPIFKWILDKLGVKEAASGAEEMAEQTAQGAAQAGGNKLGTLLSKAGTVIYIARIVLAAEDGFETAKAKTILGIIVDPTVPQRLLAAGLNAINYAIPGIGGIIPTNVLFNLLYTVFEKFGIDLGGIEEERASAQETLAEYRETTNNPGATLEEYIHNYQGQYTTQEKIKKSIGDGVKAIGTGVKNFASNVQLGAAKLGTNIKTGLKTFGSTVATKASNAWSTVKTGASNLAEGAKNVASAIGTKVGTGVDYVKEAITSITTMSKKMETIFTTPNEDFKNVIGVKVDIPDSNPLAGITRSLSSIAKVPIVAGLFIKGLGNKIYRKLISPVIDEVKTLGNIGVTSATDAQQYVSSGNLVGLWTRNSDGGNYTGLNGIVSGISDVVVNYYSTLPTIGVAIANKAKDVFNDLKQKAATVADAVDKSKNTLTPYRDAGDIKGLWAADSSPETDGSIFGIVPMISDIAYKGMYFIPTGLNLIGNKVSEIFDKAKSAIPDFSKLVSSLWEYTDTSKDMSSYDSTVDSFKTSGSGIFNGIGNGLVSGTGAIMKMVINAVRLIGGVVDKVKDVKNAAKEKVEDVKETASNAWNTVKSTASSAASAVGNAASTAVNAVGNTVSNAATAAMNWLGMGSDIHVSQKGSNRRFGASNLDQNGCGPASAATVLRAYGKNANLNDAANYAIANGYVAGASGVGTRASYFGDVLGANGISTTYTASKSGIRNAVNSGHPTVLLGQDSSNRSKANSPFGPNPHYVVARGSDTKGNVVIDDPELNGTALYNKNILKNTKLGIMTGGGSNAIKDSDGAVWNYLKSAGLSDAGTAGLMGNLYAESGITFNKVEGASIKKNTAQSHDYQRDHGFNYDSVSYTAAVDKGLKEGLAGSAETNEKPTFGVIPKYEFTHMPWKTSRQKSDGTYFGQNGYGLVQWTTAGRKDGLYELAKSKGVSISDPQTQLEYLVSELHSKYPGVLSTLTSANDVRTASNKVLIDFESPSSKYEKATQDLRTSYGETYYDKFSKNPPTSKDFGSSAFVASTGTSGTTSTTDTSSSSSGGTSTMSTSGSSTSGSLSSILNNAFSSVFQKAFGTLSGAAKSALGLIFGGFNSGDSSSSSSGTSSYSSGSTSGTNSSLTADSSIQTSISGDSTPQYGGIAKAAPVGLGTPQSMVKIAQSQLGVVEGGSNNEGNITDYGKFMGMNGQPWCASFVSWVMDKTFNGDKAKRNAALRGNPSAAVSDLWSNFKSANAMTMDPQPGDVVIYKNGSSHTGLVETVNGKTVTTIEGNTSAGEGTFDRNGGVVARHKFTIGDGSSSANKLTGFGRPNWPSTANVNYTSSGEEITGTGSGIIPLYDFTKGDRFKNYRGGESGVASTTGTQVSSYTTKSGTKLINAQDASQMSYDEKFNKMIEYLSSIASNTGYAAAIPQIISLMGDQTKVMAQLNSGASSASKTDVNNQIDTEISSMMAKLDAIATSI